MPTDKIEVPDSVNMLRLVFRYKASELVPTGPLAGGANYSLHALKDADPSDLESRSSLEYLLTELEQAGFRIAFMDDGPPAAGHVTRETVFVCRRNDRTSAHHEDERRANLTRLLMGVVWKAQLKLGGPDRATVYLKKPRRMH